MTSKINKQVLLFAMVLVFAKASFAQQVVTTLVGASTKIEIQSRVVNADTKECSILVTQPNGTTEVVILQAPDFKKALFYTPTMQGTSVVSWKGEFTLNGKTENELAGSVKQLFTNVGELVTLSKMTQGTAACPGNGTITIVATNSNQAGGAPITSTTSSNLQAQPFNRVRSTAHIPTVMNPPIENSVFKAKYNNDSTYRTMVDDFNVNRNKQSLTSLRLYSELGDANAQFLYGMAHQEDWTGLYDLKKACYWIRESAVQGLSQARLILANKAIYNKDCFDVAPTLDEAKTWAQLASMSNERAIKENAEKLLQDILRIQITNQR